MGEKDRDDSEDSPLLHSGSSMDIELHGCGATPFCNPHSFVHRYLIVLVLICFLSFGKSLLKKKRSQVINYFCSKYFIKASSFKNM